MQPSQTPIRPRPNLENVDSDVQCQNQVASSGNMIQRNQETNMPILSNDDMNLEQNELPEDIDPGTDEQWEEFVRDIDRSRAADQADGQPEVHPVPMQHGEKRPPKKERVRSIPKPMLPSRVDREKHELTHLPYQTWCRHCVLARAQNDAHRRTKKHSTEREVPVISGDFCFMGHVDQEKASPIFVLRDHNSRMTFSHMVQGKSTKNELYSDYIHSAVLKDLEYLGYKKIVFKTDQEPAMIALQERIQRSREDQTILENSPVDESQSNGVCEKAVQEVEGMTRTLKLALEERLKWRIPHDHAIMTWLVEYASILICLFREGKDKRTPMERHKGSDRDVRPIAEFGEAIWYRVLGADDKDGNKLNKMEALMEEGVWLGINLIDGTARVGTPTGVVKARTIKRRLEDERWRRGEVEAIHGTTWCPVPGVPAGVLPNAVPAPTDVPPPPPEECTEPGLMARRMRLLPRHFDEFGYTHGCEGCRAQREQIGSKNHSEICRKRIETLISAKSTEGREQVEAGYTRMADAAMRISQRTAAPPSTTTPAPAQEYARNYDPVEDPSPQKRPRQDPEATVANGSDQGGAPGTDEAARRADSTQHASGIPSSRNPVAASPNVTARFSIGTPATTPQGVKRGADGNDDERLDMDRAEDDAPTPAPTPPVTPARLTPGVSSSSNWQGAESAMIDSFNSSSRLSHMEVVRRKLGCKVDVGEIYSPPRVCAMADEMGLRKGFSLDFTTRRANGQRWDFSLPSCRREAMKLINELRPYCVIGSPPCTAWSNLQNLNKCRPGGAQKVEEAQQRAKIHLDFSAKVYRAQMRAGRYFIHEHPQSASSWKVASIQELADSPMVVKAYANMCAFGMMSKDKEGPGPVLKPTLFLTNSAEVRRELAQKCKGCSRHVQLMEGRASAAQVYPPALCRAVCRGIIGQARLDAHDLMSVKCVGGRDDINHLMEINAVEHEANDWQRY